MSNYVTTNIRLPEEDYLRLKAEAAEKRTSLSAVIREKVGSKEKLSNKEFAKVLLSLDTSWFTDKDYQDYEKMRTKDKARSRKLNW